MKKSISIILCLAMLFVFASCGKNNEDETTTTVTTTESTTEITSAVVTTTVPETTTNAPVTTTTLPETTTSAPVTTTVAGGLNSTDIAAVLDFYKKAAANTGTYKCASHMSLGEVDGKGGVATLFKMVKGLVDSAISKSETEKTEIPGKPANLTVADISSAKAVSDGKTTKITLVIADQLNAENMEAYDGSVGRAMGTLGNMKQSLSGIVSFDDNGSVKVNYTNAKISVTVDNATNKINSGEWTNTAQFSLTNATAYGIKIKELDVDLKTVIN